MKKCSKCGEEKDESEFYVRSDNGKLRADCKKCRCGKTKEYCEKHKEERKQYNKQYSKTHREQMNAYGKKYRDNHLEQEKQHSKEYYEKHKKERQEYKKVKIENDEQFYIIELLRTRLRNAFEKYSETGKVMSSKKYGIDFQKIFEHIGSCPGNREDYCIDHIKPLCSFDFNNLEQIKLAFAPENHRWITREENLKKSNEDKKMKFKSPKMGSPKA